MIASDSHTAVRASLRAMLRATAPSEALLPEGERLVAVRPVAVRATHAACESGWVGADLTALLTMLNATCGYLVNAHTIVPARVLAHAALDGEPVVAGTRLPARTVLLEHLSGTPFDVMAEHRPSLTQARLEAVIRWGGGPEPFPI